MKDQEKQRFTVVTDLEALDAFAHYSHFVLGVAELGGLSRALVGNGAVIDHGDTDGKFEALLDRIREVFGYDLMIEIEGAHLESMCRETQRSYLRGGVHRHAFDAGGALDDEAVSAHVDGYVKVCGA